MPIDLSKPRVFAFETRGRKHTMTCKPITKEMWLKYFAGIVSTSTSKEDGEIENAYDSTGARVELLEAALIDATGYTPEGERITDKPGWQSKLPFAHRRAIADLLPAAEAVPATEDSYELGLETVTLRATWTADEATGKMQEVTGLKHVFRSPTADHQKRYSRAMSRSVVSGGRNGETRWLGGQGVLIEIYDELIQSTDGYLLAGAVLAEGTPDMAQMDAYHKVAAVSALFAPAEL